MILTDVKSYILADSELSPLGCRVLHILDKEHCRKDHEKYTNMREALK